MDYSTRRLIESGKVEERLEGLEKLKGYPHPRDIPDLIKLMQTDEDERVRSIALQIAQLLDKHITLEKIPAKYLEKDKPKRKNEDTEDEVPYEDEDLQLGLNAVGLYLAGLTVIWVAGAIIVASLVPVSTPEAPALDFGQRLVSMLGTIVANVFFGVVGFIVFSFAFDFGATRIGGQGAYSYLLKRMVLPSLLINALNMLGGIVLTVMISHYLLKIDLLTLPDYFVMETRDFARLSAERVDFSIIEGLANFLMVMLSAVSLVWQSVLIGKNYKLSATQGCMSMALGGLAIFLLFFVCGNMLGILMAIF